MAIKLDLTKFEGVEGGKQKKEESAVDVGIDFGQKIGNTLTFGQAPHIAGFYDALGGAIYNKLHGNKNTIKDFYQDYENAREKFKKDQKEFDENHKKLALTGDVVGAIGTLPVGGAVAKIPRIAQILKGANALEKGAMAGASWGGAYGLGQGLSNTEGKGVDVKSGLVGGGIGTLAGGTIGAAIPLSVMGVKGGINAISKLPQKMATGYKGSIEQYVVPEGVQTKTFRKLAKSPEIQKEALRGDIGMRAEELQNKATEKVVGFVPELFEKVSQDYKAIPKNTFISFDKTNAVGKMLQAVKDFQFATKFMPKESIEKEVNNLVQKVAKSGKTVNNEYGISFENLQSAMKTTWENSQKAFNNGDNAVGKLYSDIYNVLREARATNPKIERASQRYADISDAKELIEKGLGVKFEKGANHRQLATKLIQNARNRAGTQLDDAINKATEILKKHPDLKGAEEMHKAIDLAQVSYDFRPPEESKLLNSMPTKKGIRNKIFGAIFEKSPQEKARLLSKNLKEGRITLDDVVGQFDIVKGGTNFNRFLQNQKVYGGKYNLIGNIMRNKRQVPTMPLFLLEEGNRVNSLIRNPLIFAANRKKQELRKLI